MTKPLTNLQRVMLEKIGSFDWVDLSPTGISPKNTMLISLRNKGLLQTRTTQMAGADDFVEVRLVVTEQLVSSYKDAVQHLIDSMAPVVRRLLAKEIAAVQQHLNKEEGND